MATSNWASVLVSNLWAGPYLLIFVIGLAFAAANFSKCPRVAVLSAVAFLILTGTLLAGIAMHAWVVLGHSSPADIGRWYTVFGFIRALFDFVAFGLLLTAAFIDRSAKLVAPKEQW